MSQYAGKAPNAIITAITGLYVVSGSRENASTDASRACEPSGYPFAKLCTTPYAELPAIGARSGIASASANVTWTTESLPTFQPSTPGPSQRYGDASISSVMPEPISGQSGRPRGPRRSSSSPPASSAGPSVPSASVSPRSPSRTATTPQVTMQA